MDMALSLLVVMLAQCENKKGGGGGELTMVHFRESFFFSGSIYLQLV